ncbi:MAG: T9SS type A sorting domain-containing protein [Cytophagales bacterium]
MKSLTRLSVLPALFLFAKYNVHGQSLKIDFVDKSNTQIFTIANVKNVNFGTAKTALNVKQSSGVTAYSLSNVRKLTFDLTTDVNDVTTTNTNEVYVTNTIFEQNVELVNATAKIAPVEIFHLEGKLIQTLELPQGNTLVDFSNQPKGMYLIKTENSTIKVLKK